MSNEHSYERLCDRYTKKQMAVDLFNLQKALSVKWVHEHEFYLMSIDGDTDFYQCIECGVKMTENKTMNITLMDRSLNIDITKGGVRDQFKFAKQ